MTLKNNWTTGNAFTASDQNAVATQVNTNTTDIAAKQSTSAKNQANGYAGLDGSAKVAAAQLPSYVDDAVEFANLAGFPGTGETGKIYVALDTGKIYRWSGSAYTEISPSPGSTDSVTEGSTNLYHTNARVDARIAASGLSEALDTKAADSAVVHNTGDESIAGTKAFSHKPKVDFGICQSEITNPDWFDETEIRSVLQGIKDRGATYVRTAAWWLDIEPTLGGSYVWTGMDRAMNLCEEYGLKPVLVVNRPTPTGSPTITDFADLCAALAARYGAQGTGQAHHYQIWNESNHTEYASPFATGAATYTDLLIAASTAIRAADSEAFIISEGLMSTVNYMTSDISPSTFLDAIYTEGGKGYFDAVGYHWYSHPGDFSGWEEPTRDQIFYEELIACRAVMVDHDDADTPIWVTEIGQHISLDPVVRGKWLTQQIELVTALPYVEKFFIYNYRPGAADLGIPDNQYSLVDFDFDPLQPVCDFVASINANVPAALAYTDEAVEIDDITGLQTALDGKAPLASPAFTGTPTGISKAHVGLGNVDNTSDTAKPVSTAQQTALNLKAPLASPTFTGTVAGITKAMVGLANVDNTSDAAKPVSTLQQAALDGKANTVHSHRSVVTLTTTATLAASAGTDYAYLIGTSGLPTMPTAVGNTSRYTLKNTTASAVTVSTTSSQTIDGSTTYPLVPGESIDLVSNNANWWVI